MNSATAGTSGRNGGLEAQDLEIKGRIRLVNERHDLVAAYYEGYLLDGLIIAAGFSGHGFKISPSVGRLVADLVVDGTSSDPDVPESDFRLSRFAEGELLRSPHPYVGAGQMR